MKTVMKFPKEGYDITMNTCEPSAEQCAERIVPKWTEACRLRLQIPAYEELGYRQRLLADPDTMSYNKGYELSFDGYDRETGCIAFPESRWRDWYGFFVGQEPQRFYAYVVRNRDGALIGEVNVRKNEDEACYDMGIVLEAKHRGNGYAKEALELLLKHAFEALGAEAVRNCFEATREAAVRTHLAAGFTECGRENGNVELRITKEAYFRRRSIEAVTAAIGSVLFDCRPSVYLYGSSVLDDFRLGWSDIDILVLTRKPISETQAETLLTLRQALLEKEPDNPYYRSFEGGMLSLPAFVSQSPDRVVYWGTSGERIADRYSFDSFCMAELLESGVLLYGEEIRGQLRTPGYAELYADVKRSYEAIRKHAQKTGRSFYSFGWLLDIARGLYTLRTGTVIAKTAAGEWALENGLCPAKEALETALKIRREPLRYKENQAVFDYAETLGAEIQRFADVLERELERTRSDPNVMIKSERSMRNEAGRA